MRGIWIANTVLMVGMTVSGAALLAQQATTPAPETTTTQGAASATGRPQLSEEQKKQLSGLRNSMRDQAAIIRHDQTLTAEQKQAELKALHASTREQMKSVLTPEQQKKIKTFMQNRGAGGGPGGGHMMERRGGMGRPPGRPGGPGGASGGSAPKPQEPPVQ